MKLDRPKFHNFEPGQFPDESSPFDVVELKFDGWWGQLLLVGKEWKLFSRTGQLKKFGPLSEPMEHTLLHGEFCFGTEWAKDNPDFYNKIAVYGAEVIEGKNVRNLAQQEVRNQVVDLMPRLQREPIVGGLFPVAQWSLSMAEELWKEMRNFEGLVFKNSHDVWGSAYGRMKRASTMEYICLGFEASDSDRHAGWGVASVLGGLIPRGKDGPIQVCKVSGLDDATRAMFYQHPERFVGKVFEANGKKITKSGALRHPNFVRWRPDKNPSECRWPQHA